MEEFIKLVEQMRITQKEYFKTRNFKVLEKARGLEREVDQAIERNKNPKLFEN